MPMDTVGDDAGEVLGASNSVENSTRQEHEKVDEWGAPIRRELLWLMSRLLFAGGLVGIGLLIRQPVEDTLRIAALSDIESYRQSEQVKALKEIRRVEQHSGTATRQFEMLVYAIHNNQLGEANELLVRTRAFTDSLENMWVYRSHQWDDRFERSIFDLWRTLEGGTFVADRALRLPEHREVLSARLEVKELLLERQRRVVRTRFEVAVAAIGAR